MTRLALIAHDEEKAEMVELAKSYESVLADFELVSTGTTGKRVMEATDLDVERKQSGPVGGDAQIAAEVADALVDGVVFLQDPLTAQPHEPDITALVRICDVHDTPLATTRSTAEYVLDGLAADHEGG